MYYVYLIHMSYNIIYWRVDTYYIMRSFLITKSIIIYNDNKFLMKFMYLNLMLIRTIYVHTHIYTHNHIYAYLYIHIYIHIYKYIHTNTHIHAHTCTYTHIHTYTQIHTNIHTYHIYNAYKNRLIYNLNSIICI